MKRALISTAVLGILLASVAPAQEAKKSGVKAELLRQIADAEKKLVALAETIPAEKYAWRPGQGVRSPGEVFAHVADVNYVVPTFWGVKLPQGVDPNALEKDGADKAKTLATLKKSFAFTRKAIEEVPDANLDKAIKVYGSNSNIREGILGITTHAYEHLGQAIAYARMNKIVPPWSR
jgi:uncharacterized damage-inducible protein DinB